MSHIVIKSTEERDADGFEFELSIPPCQVGLEAIRYGSWGQTLDEHAWTVPWSASELLPLVTWYNLLVYWYNLLKFLGLAPDHPDVTMLESGLCKRFVDGIPYCREGMQTMGYKASTATTFPREHEKRVWRYGFA
jgi:hypothetical protein